MKTTLFITMFTLLFVFTCQTANAEYWHPPEKKDRWNFSIAPGYGLLYVAEDKTARNGFGGRLQANYGFTKNWGIDLKSRLGIYDGDSNGLQGIYSIYTLSVGARYTFNTNIDWIEPYVFLGLGYAYTELDREINRVIHTHSMILEPGGGVSFKVTKKFWLGLELAACPILFGDSKISNSFFFQTLLSAELHI